MEVLKAAVLPSERLMHSLRDTKWAETDSND